MHPSRGGQSPAEKEHREMKTIKAKDKAEFEALKKAYREKGYNFLTFGTKVAEMENRQGDVVIIERK